MKFSSATIIFCAFAALLFCGPSSKAQLQWSAGIDSNNNISLIIDPVTMMPVAIGSAVYLIYDSDGDGSVGDVDAATGAPINDDVIVDSLTAYAIGDNVGIPGSVFEITPFVAMNQVLMDAGQTMGNFYVRVFNVPDPASAPGIIAYGDSYATDPTVASSANPIGGYYKYTIQDVNADPAPPPQSWVVENIELTERIPEPSTFALMGLGLLGFMFMRRRFRRED